ncbi:MAG: SprT-like domain-containing protein [Candidatus Woesearchaeota archaeon]
MDENVILENIQSKLKKIGIEKEIRIKYTRNNLNISIFKSTYLEIRLGKRWKNVNDTFVLGGIELIMKKIYKSYPIDRNAVDMYLNFIKQLSDLEIVTEQDSRLKKLYDEVNAKFFNKELGETNLIWKGNGNKVVAKYNFFRNTISINEKFKNSDDEILKYILYHEMLHKYLKFKGSIKRKFHTETFRKLEKSYPNSEELEKRIIDFLRKNH